jgi:hypothetical protein
MPEYYVQSMSFIIAMAIVIVMYRNWFTRTGAVPEFIAQAERTNLLEAIETSATEPHMRITLATFWRGRGWTRRERSCLLGPLIQQGILHIPYSDQPAERLLQATWYSILAQPPNTVILNSRDWTRLATDRSGREPSIIIGRISGGANQIGGAHNTISQQELSADHVMTLIAALREDARGRDEVRAPADEAADGLEAALETRQLGDVSRWVRTTAALARSSAEAMTSTRKVLEALGLL